MLKKKEPTKKTYYRVTLSGSTCVMSRQQLMDEVLIFSNEGVHGDEMVIELVDLTEKEYESLPEHAGW